MDYWVKNLGIECVLIDYDEGFLGLVSRATDEDEIICKEKEVAVCVFNYWWSELCMLYNVGLVIMLNNPISFANFHPVVAIKLFDCFVFTATVHWSPCSCETIKIYSVTSVTDDATVNCTLHATCNATRLCCIGKLYWLLLCSLFLVYWWKLCELKRFERVLDNLTFSARLSCGYGLI